MCPGFKKEIQKCNMSICPQQTKATLVEKLAPRSAWSAIASIFYMEQESENEIVPFFIAADCMAKFSNINWDSRLQNPDSTEFKVLADEIERSLSDLMTQDFKEFTSVTVIKFAAEQDAVKVKRSTASLTFGVFVHFIMVSYSDFEKNILHPQPP